MKSKLADHKKQDFLLSTLGGVSTHKLTVKARLGPRIVLSIPGEEAEGSWGLKKVLEQGTE